MNGVGKAGLWANKLMFAVAHTQSLLFTQLAAVPCSYMVGGEGCVH